MSDTLLEQETITEIIPFEEHENPAEHRTHIINPPNNLHIWLPGMSSRDIVDLARAKGIEVRALCGYVWVPKANPENYDACETCMKLAGELLAGAGE